SRQFTKAAGHRLRARSQSTVHEGGWAPTKGPFTVDSSRRRPGTD
ncbi:hypothetical protein LSAT2_013117, partial [Lamellibrachia satsuma]